LVRDAITRRSIVFGQRRSLEQIRFLGARRKMALKIALIGNANVGKTYSVNTLLNGVPLGRYRPTIGCDTNAYRSINGTPMGMWDIAGDTTFIGHNNLNNISLHCQHVDVFIYYQTTRQPQNGDMTDAVWYEFMNNCSPNAQIVLFGGNLGAILDTF
jgi:GTPase SAR1 family protein